MMVTVNREPCSGVLFTLMMPPHHAGNILGDGQPKADSVNSGNPRVFPAAERFKDMRQERFRHPDSVVPEKEVIRAAAVFPGFVFDDGDLQYASRRGIIDRVSQDIQEDLPKSQPVS